MDFMTSKIINEVVLVDKEYFTMNIGHTGFNGLKIYKECDRTSTRQFTFFKQIIAT